MDISVNSIHIKFKLLWNTFGSVLGVFCFRVVLKLIIIWHVKHASWWITHTHLHTPLLHTQVLPLSNALQSWCIRHIQLSWALWPNRSAIMDMVSAHIQTLAYKLSFFVVLFKHFVLLLWCCCCLGRQQDRKNTFS